MTHIRNVTIIGAGAMGAAYAAMFSVAPDFNLTFLARGERLQRLRAAPLTVNGKAYAIPAVSPEDIRAPADLVLVALKHHHLSEALPDIKRLVGSETVILSVMNGLDSETLIGAACGMNHMLHAIAVGIDAVREEGRFTYASPGRIVFGDIPDDPASLKVVRLQEALTRAAIPHETPADMRRVLWWKFMINVGINQASAVLGAPYGVFQTSAEAANLMGALMREVIGLARPAGVDLSAKDLKAWHRVLTGLSPQGKTSMLQDIQAGRKTEVEIFAGKVISLGSEYGVPTPVNQTVQYIIRAIEGRHKPPEKPFDLLSMDWYR